MKTVILAAVLALPPFVASHGQEIADYDRNSIMNASMASSADLNCNTLSLNATAAAIVDELYQRSKENDATSQAWAEGFAAFYNMSNEDLGLACLTVLRSLPMMFDVTFHGETYSGEEFAKKAESLLEAATSQSATTGSDNAPMFTKKDAYAFGYINAALHECRMFKEAPTRFPRNDIATRAAITLNQDLVSIAAAGAQSFHAIAAKLPEMACEIALINYPDAFEKAN